MYGVQEKTKRTSCKAVNNRFCALKHQLTQDVADHKGDSGTTWRCFLRIEKRRSKIVIFHSIMQSPATEKEATILSFKKHSSNISVGDCIVHTHLLQNLGHGSKLSG